MLRFLAIALIAAGLPVHAAPVTVVVEGIQNQYDDAGGYLPFAQPDEFATWVLTFTYDSESADVNPDPIAGEYPGAISAISLSIGGSAFQSFADNSVVMLNDNGNPEDGYADLWLASTFDAEPYRSSFGLTLINFGGSALESDALVPPSWPFPPWGLGFIEYSIEDRSSPDPGNGLTLGYANGRVTGLTVVPAPPAIWLLGTACLGALGWRRRPR